MRFSIAEPLRFAYAPRALIDGRRCSGRPRRHAMRRAPASAVDSHGRRALRHRRTGARRRRRDCTACSDGTSGRWRWPCPPVGRQAPRGHGTRKRGVPRHPGRYRRARTELPPVGLRLHRVRFDDRRRLRPPSRRFSGRRLLRALVAAGGVGQVQDPLGRVQGVLQGLLPVQRRPSLVRCGRALRRRGSTPMAPPIAFGHWVLMPELHRWIVDPTPVLFVLRLPVTTCRVYGAMGPKFRRPKHDL